MTNCFLRPRLFVLLCLCSPIALAFNLHTAEPTVYSPANEEGYFGFTVSLHENTEGHWILAGAPLANSKFQSGLKEPGALYKCPVSDPLACEQIKLDDQGNEIGGSLDPPFSYVDIKDGQFLGGSLSHQLRKNGLVAVCGHRWANDLDGFNIYPNGVCYIINGNFEFSSVQKIRPCITEPQFVNDASRPGGILIAHGWCQAGISSHFSDYDNRTLLLGAPGSYVWKGSPVRFVISETDLDTGGIINRRDTSAQLSSGVAFPDTSSWSFSLSDDSYLGYSTGLGQFASTDSVDGVSGAPRASQTGMVYIYDLVDFSLVTSLAGEQPYSGFGTTVCVVDANGDGLSDLLVGAPIYASNIEEGRVYLYLNQGQGILKQDGEALSGSNRLRARFGTSIAVAGDLNQDGYEDVVIGAPYEDELAGTVYIYLGTGTTINHDYSQRVSGKSLVPGIQSFGYSVGGDLDMDNNGYPDIVVGSYQSNSVVLIKSSAVVDVLPTIELSTQLIDLESEKTCQVDGKLVLCLDTTVCLSYEGLQVPDTIELNYTLRTEGMRIAGVNPRLQFIDGSSLVGIEVTNQLTLQKNTQQCQIYKTYVREDTLDLLTPILFELSYELVSSGSQYEVGCTAGSGCPPAVLNLNRPQPVQHMAAFQFDCGPDNICISDLKLSGEIEKTEGYNYIPLGAFQSVYVSITLANVGEDAHQAEMVMFYPGELNFVNVETLSNQGTAVSCSPESTNDADLARLKCLVGNPLRANTKIDFKVQLDISRLSWERESLTLMMVTTTTSDDPDSSNNFLNVSTPIKLEADITISGISSPEDIQYGTDKDFSDAAVSVLSNYSSCQISGEKVVHQYLISNLGPSHIPFLSRVDIDWPVKTSEDNFLLLLVQAKIINGEGNCSTHSVIDEQNLSFTKYCSTFEGSSSEDTNGYTVTSRRKRASQSGDSAGNLFNCDHVQCLSFSCLINSLNRDSAAVIEVESRLWRNTLYQSDFNEVKLVSRAFVSVEADSDIFRQPTLHQPDNAEVATNAFRRFGSSTIPVWIIVISVIGGILLLVIIVVVFYKIGFFNRKEKEDLERLKNNMSKEEIEPCLT